MGEVVQVGPGKRNDNGSLQAPEVSLGDKVLYSKYAGTDIKLGSDEYVLLSEKDILAIVNGVQYSWFKKKGITISGCSDWFKPVLFKIEKINK